MLPWLLTVFLACPCLIKPSKKLEVHFLMLFMRYKTSLRLTLPPLFLACAYSWMPVCMCLCVHVPVWACAFVSMYLSKHVPLCACTFVCMYICVHEPLCSRTSVCMYLCVHVPLWECLWRPHHKLCCFSSHTTYIILLLLVYLFVCICVCACMHVHSSVHVIAHLWRSESNL